MCGLPAESKAIEQSQPFPIVVQFQLSVGAGLGDGADVGETVGGFVDETVGSAVRVGTAVDVGDSVGVGVGVAIGTVESGAINCTAAVWFK